MAQQERESKGSRSRLTVFSVVNYVDKCDNAAWTFSNHGLLVIHSG